MGQQGIVERQLGWMEGACCCALKNGAVKTQLNELDDFIEKSREEWQVPGAAVLVIQNGAIVYKQGFGLRSLNGTEKVDTKTLMATCSVTKTFTALLAAIMEDSGQLSLNRRVFEYAPIKMKDEVVSARMTLVDMLSHRTGLPRHDAVFFKAKRAEDAVEALEHLDFAADFREQMIYNNLMYVTAAHIMSKVSGKSWGELIRTLILEPTNMTTTELHVADARKTDNFADPHIFNIDSKPVVSRPLDDSVAGPAGSINSNVEDLGNYMLMLLNNGKFGDTVVVSPHSLQRLWTLHTPSNPQWAYGQNPGYGIGWCVESYRGARHVHHEGGVPGWRSHLSLLPDERSGVVILSNAGDSMFTEVITYTILDYLLGLTPQAWSDRLTEEWAALRADATQAVERLWQSRIVPSELTLPIQEYAGSFDAPGYGVFDVIYNETTGTLSTVVSQRELQLFHWHNETFAATVLSPDKPVESLLFFEFEKDESGKPNTLIVPFEPMLDPIRLRRVRN
eukprot:GILJ01010455.1.p1 GENE.GILJ01010455.1~~GILJ01010455.1.p1  ORF type:complete len:507 (+),score=75.03 GILJ01010455.1:1-1521(+)